MDATMSPLQKTTANDRHHSPRIDVLFFPRLNAAILIASPEALSIQQVGTFKIEHVCDSQSICRFLCATVLPAVFFRIIGALVAQVR